MRERITANLPSRNLAATEAFYVRLGFETAFRDLSWMVLRRGPLEVEFYPQPGIDPADSHASACVRVADVDRLHAEWKGADLPEEGIPRLSAPRDEDFGWRMFVLVDPDGNLLRCLTPIGGP